MQVYASSLLVLALVSIPGFFHCQLCLELAAWIVGRFESLLRRFLSPTDFAKTMLLVLNCRHDILQLCV